MITPKMNGLYFEANFVYEEKEIEHDLDEKKMIGVDLGVNNLAACCSNTGSSMIVDGKKLKSINQGYNKQKAILQSNLPKNIKTSKKIKLVSRKRGYRVNDYISKAAREIIEFTLGEKANTLVLGYNKGWKQSINIGKKNTQNFVSIPFHKLKGKLEYLCKLNGIKFLETEESYTSKCSFFDNELPKKHEKYLGKRILRGLFQTKSGYRFNADINGVFWFFYAHTFLQAFHFFFGNRSRNSASTNKTSNVWCIANHIPRLISYNHFH